MHIFLRLYIRPDKELLETVFTIYTKEDSFEILKSQLETIEYSDSDFLSSAVQGMANEYGFKIVGFTKDGQLLSYLSKDEFGFGELGGDQDALDQYAFEKKQKLKDTPIQILINKIQGRVRWYDDLLNLRKHKLVGKKLYKSILKYKHGELSKQKMLEHFVESYQSILNEIQ